MNKVREFFQNLYHYDLNNMGRWQRLSITILRFLTELKQQFVKDTVVVRASGMAYTTLLAIVPLVAVFFSIFTALFADEMRQTIQEWLITQIMPANQEDLLTYIGMFTANTKTLGLFSSIALLLTALLLFDNIEKNFNAIWNVARSRTFLRRFMAFTMVLVWGPVLIALSFYTSGRLRALLADFNLTDIAMLRFSLGLIPWMLTVVAFFLMIMVIPATKVRYKSALVGGLVGGTLWEFAKIGFSAYVVKSITYSTIYGSLALIPFFLVWLYLTWIIVLFSVEVSYVHNNLNSLILHRMFAKVSARDRVHLSLRIFGHISDAFYRGKKPVDIDEIAEKFLIPYELVEELLRVFEGRDLLVRTDLGKDQVGFVPGQSISSLNWQQVMDAAYRGLEETGEIESVDPIDQQVQELIATAEEAVGRVLTETRLLETIKRAGGREAEKA